jgi:hypothetical protein
MFSNAELTRGATCQRPARAGGQVSTSRPAFGYRGAARRGAKRGDAAAAARRYREATSFVADPVHAVVMASLLFSDQ